MRASFARSVGAARYEIYRSGVEALLHTIWDGGSGIGISRLFHK